MRLSKRKSDFGTDISLVEDNKELSFVYGGNLDLYWTLHSDDTTVDNTFTITKENYQVYQLFEELFMDIDTINIFYEDVPFYLDSSEEIREYLKRKEEEQEEDKKRYRLYNSSHYNDLYNSKNQTITWYSDETSSKVSNYLIIRKADEEFIIEFHTQDNIKGYDDDFKSKFHIPIRFRNSGSSYDPFNLIFMKMYNSMKEVDDVNDANHQIHIEEYLYQKVKRKKD